MIARVKRRHRGFTLIEAISTIVILGILGSITSNIILAASDGYLDAATSAQLHTDGSIALDRIVRELRNVQLDPDAGGIAPDIENVTTTSISWHDNDDDDYGIALSGTNVTLQIDGAAAQVLLADVSAFSVQTFDQSNTALAATLSGNACDDIRRVLITITMTRDGVSETLRSKVFLRSTMAGASL